MRVKTRVRSVNVKPAQRKAAIAQRKATAATVDAARIDTHDFVPYREGNLRRTAETESKPEQGLLVYGNSSVPYASAQYYGLPGKTWPGTVMHWFARAKAAFGRRWTRVNKEEYQRHFRGR
jgi:hypothetical protein